MCRLRLYLGLFIILMAYSQIAYGKSEVLVCTESYYRNGATDSSEITIDPESKAVTSIKGTWNACYEGDCSVSVKKFTNHMLDFVLTHGNMTDHIRIDRLTGALWSMSYNPNYPQPPYHEASHGTCSLAQQRF